MKTPEQIESERWSHFEQGCSMKSWIALIQADARQGMVEASQLEQPIKLLSQIIAEDQAALKEMEAIFKEDFSDGKPAQQTQKLIAIRDRLESLLKGQTPEEK